MLEQPSLLNSTDCPCGGLAADLATRSHTTRLSQEWQILGGCPGAQTTLLAIKTWISARDIPGISLKSLHGSEQSPLTVMSIQFVGGHFVVPLQYLFRKHAVTQHGNFIKQHIGFLLMS